MGGATLQPASSSTPSMTKVAFVRTARATGAMRSCAYGSPPAVAGAGVAGRPAAAESGRAGAPASQLWGGWATHCASTAAGDQISTKPSDASELQINRSARLVIRPTPPHREPAWVGLRGRTSPQVQAGRLVAQRSVLIRGVGQPEGIAAHAVGRRGEGAGSHGLR